MTILLYDESFLKHDTGAGHPENPQRISNTTEYLKTSGLWDKIGVERPSKASFGEINSVHDLEYIEHVMALSKMGGGMLDPDTVVSEASSDAALYAAGAAISAIDKIMQGGDETAFCLIRPPGHHALPYRGMGFCLFNNVAVAARYLQSRHNIERVAIIDWDVHHGNGTQDIFYDDPSVLYFSIHRFPFYPGTGTAEEKGCGKGYGFTINLPLAYGTKAKEYIRLFEQTIKGEVKGYAPEFVLVSCGFDAYKGDPIGGLGLDVSDFKELTGIVVQLAKDCCRGRIVSCLEGGYNVRDLPRCIEAHLKALSS